MTTDSYRRVSPLLVAISVMLLSSCGRSSSTGPSAAPAPTPVPTLPTVLTVTGGDTGRPVVGAQVIVAGVPLITDAAGQVRPSGATNGVTVDIIASGYLDRQTLVRDGAEALSHFTLWPRRPLPSFDEEYTRTFLYTRNWTSTPDTNVPLLRLGAGTTQVRLVLSQELFSDSTSRFFHQFAADAMNTAVSGRFRYTVGDVPVPGYFNATVVVDPAGSSCGPRTLGYTSWRTSRGDITDVSIVYCSSKAAKRGDTVVHEVGHTLGLAHSVLRSDVMYAFANGADVFTDRELLMMKLMYQRPGGNVFPDNDRATSGLASAGSETIVCGR